MTRRRTLGFLGRAFGAAAAFSGCSLLAGPRSYSGTDPDAPPLSPAAQRLVDDAWRGLTPEACWDVHAHLVGLGAGGTGCKVSPSLTDPASLVQGVKYAVYRRAAGIEDDTRADAEYVERLVALKRDWSPRGKIMLLAFDDAYHEDGSMVANGTDFATPNAYARDVAAAHPEHFVWAASVHPYRADWKPELERWVAAGARLVKWLPNAQRMDADHPKCREYFRWLADHRIPLLSHVGEEQAVEAAEQQRFGNPLRFRRALDAGVTLIMAHAGSLGHDEDIDPGAEKRCLESFDLFMRLFTRKEYEKTLFADLSAMIQFNRSGRPMRELLRATNLHPRLLYGTDYPLPAIDVIVRLSTLVSRGYLDDIQVGPLREIYLRNPLTFTFVLLRTMHADGSRFAPSVFETSRIF